ncbi:MAG: DUF6350 family protein [Propionibacteriaceae bacterium]|nr:DUF6350 family protein [Propionibacteriaceae bacterium]
MAHEDSITRTLTVEVYKPQPERVRAPAMPWWAAGIGGAVVCAVGVWAIIAAVALLSQLAQTGGVTGVPMDFATRFWLLAHSGILTMAGSQISLIPLGVTAIVALTLHGVGGYAAKQALSSVDDLPEVGATVAKVAGVVAGVYTVVVTAVAMVFDMGGPALRAGGGAAVLGLVMAFLGARRALDWTPTKSWPMWTRAIPKAAMAAVLVCLLGGVVSLIASLVAHRDQFITMTDQLHPGGVGGTALVLLQLAYVVNIVIWCASWTTGAGFTLGDGSLITLLGSHVGLLPPIPVTAIIPAPVGSWWNLAWLGFPVAAGMVAAVVVLRARPRARFDETALVGGLSGVVAGGCFALVAALSRGGLGVGRLSFVGPHLGTVAVLSGCLMGISGVIAGLVMGLIRGASGEPNPKWWAHWRSDEPDVPTLYKPQPATPVWVVPEEPTERIGDKSGGAAASNVGEDLTVDLTDDAVLESVPAVPVNKGKAAATARPGLLARFLHRGTKVFSQPEPEAEPVPAADASPTEEGRPEAEESLTQVASEQSDEKATEEPTKEPDPAQPPDEQPPLDFFADER